MNNVDACLKGTFKSTFTPGKERIETVYLEKRKERLENVYREKRKERLEKR